MLGDLAAAKPAERGLVASGLRLGTKLRSQFRAVTRLGWGVADQAVSSATNFAVVIYIARTLGATQLGAFSLAYVAYGFAINASRGLATEPLVVRFSGTDVATWRREAASCTGTAISTGLALGMVSLGTAALLHGVARSGFLALGLTLPVLLLQDSWRFCFFALGRGSQSFLNDSIWGIVLLPSLVLLKETGHANVFYFVLAWGASAGVAAAVGPLQARVIPRVGETWYWISRHRDLGMRYVAENTSQSISQQVTTYAFDGILGLTAVGYLQAQGTLMGPIQVLMFGLSIVMVAEAARVLRRSPRRLPLFCMAISGVLAIGGFLWGVFLLVMLPRGIGNLVLGPALWRHAYPLVLPAMIGVMGQSISSGAGAGLHALGAAKRSMRTVLFTTSTYIVLTITGAVVHGIIGAVTAMAFCSWLAGIMLWWQFRAAVRESEALRVERRAFSRRAGRHRRPRGSRISQSHMVLDPRLKS